MLVQLALYSDRFYMAAVGVYVFAMVLHGWEFARARTAAPEPAALLAGREGSAPAEVGAAGVGATAVGLRADAGHLAATSGDDA